MSDKDLPQTPSDLLMKAFEEAGDFAGVIILSIDKAGTGKIFNGVGDKADLVFWLATFQQRVTLGLFDSEKEP